MLNPFTCFAPWAKPYIVFLFDSAAANQFTGPLPEEFGNLSRLSELYISENQLTGTVPESVLHLPLLKKTYLHDNLFVGDYDSTLCNVESPFQFRNGSSFVDVGADCYTTSEITCSCCSFCCDSELCCDLYDTLTGDRTCTPRT